MFTSIPSASLSDAFRARYRVSPPVTLTRCPQDSDATGAPAWFPVTEPCPDPMPQADGCP
jgi:hypothetical protein